MKKNKLKVALLSLAAVTGISVGIAIATEPEVCLAPGGVVGVQPNEPYTFFIDYRNANEIIVTIDNNINDDLWMWPWQEEDSDWRTKEYTDEIPYYNTTREYKVIVKLGKKQSIERTTYITPLDPNPIM